MGMVKKLGESRGNSKTLKWVEKWGQGVEVGGATVESKAKTPLIERHFHMYILQMYIDTIR